MGVWKSLRGVGHTFDAEKFFRPRGSTTSDTRSSTLEKPVSSVTNLSCMTEQYEDEGSLFRVSADAVAEKVPV